MHAKTVTEAFMPFGDHLDELRRRLIYALWGALPVLIVSLVFGQSVLAFVLRPVSNAMSAAGQQPVLQAITALEAFVSYVKVSFLLTLIVSGPWLLLQLWLFVAPGLYASERRFAYLLAPLSVVLTACGMVFLYKVMLPIMLLFGIQFGQQIGQSPLTPVPLPPGIVLAHVPVLDGDPETFEPGAAWINSRTQQLRFAIGEKNGKPLVGFVGLSVGTGMIQVQPRVADSVSLILGCALAFAVAFQAPVVVLLLGWAGLVTPELLSKYRKHSVFACAVLGALITPSGDPLSMSLLAVPLYLLYEFGMVLLRLLPASRVARGFGEAGPKGFDQPPFTPDSASGP